MTTPDQVRDDLRFVRGALERQARLQQAIFTPWFALAMGTWVLALCVLKDVAVPWEEPIEQAISYLILTSAALLPYHELRRRGELPHCTWADGFRMLLPWVVCAAAVFLFRAFVPSNALTPLQSLQVGLLMVALTAFGIGQAGSLTMLAISAALGLGVVAFQVLPAYAWSAFGALVFLGLVGGTVMEVRRARR